MRPWSKRFIHCPRASLCSAYVEEESSQSPVLTGRICNSWRSCGSVWRVLLPGSVLLPGRTTYPSDYLRDEVSASARQNPTALDGGAGRGNRTPKGRSPADFESAASASSAIPARKIYLSLRKSVKSTLLRWRRAG